MMFQVELEHPEMIGSPFPDLLLAGEATGPAKDFPPFGGQDPLAGEFFGHPENYCPPDSGLKKKQKTSSFGDNNNELDDILDLLQDSNASDIDVIDDTNLYSPSSISSCSDINTNNNTQDLIDEMEDFLSYHENNNNNNSVTMSSSETPMSRDDDMIMTDQEVDEAEQILNALVKGNVTSSSSKMLTDVSETSRQDVVRHLSDLMDTDIISNVSEIVTESGEKVVIVVTRDTTNVTMSSSSPGHDSLASSPGHQSQASEASSLSDSDWCSDAHHQPELEEDIKTVKTKRGSKAGYKRGPYKRSGGVQGIRDRKERKKRQNVEAARRYRDKKRSLQSVIEGEEQVVLARNQMLRAKLGETESELKTLKKLMAELGLIKIT